MYFVSANVIEKMLKYKGFSKIGVGILLGVRKEVFFLILNSLITRNEMNKLEKKWLSLKYFF